MKKRMMIFMLVCTTVLMACKNTQKTEQKQAQKQETTNTEQTDATEAKITLVSPDEAENMLAKGNVQLIDVRTLEEVAEGKIEGAVNMIYQENFKEKIKSLDPSKPVLVYCRSGKRSGICATTLQEAGFEKIYDLEGGIKAWKKAEKPLVK